MSKGNKKEPRVPRERPTPPDLEKSRPPTPPPAPERGGEVRDPTIPDEVGQEPLPQPPPPSDE